MLSELAKLNPPALQILAFQLGGIVAMVLLLKQYLVNVGFVGTEVLDLNYTRQFPLEVLPLFYAMMYGATLGCNKTLVGASSNIIAAGIAEQHGKAISFQTFLRYGIPVMLVQLVDTFDSFPFLVNREKFDAKKSSCTFWSFKESVRQTG